MHTLKHLPSRQTVARLKAGADRFPRCEVGAQDWQLPYQKCRFCERGIGEIRSLIKYAVRHYICADCLKEFCAMPAGSFRSRPSRGVCYIVGLMLVSSFITGCVREVRSPTSPSAGYALVHVVALEVATERPIAGVTFGAAAVESPAYSMMAQTDDGGRCVLTVPAGELVEIRIMDAGPRYRPIFAAAAGRVLNTEQWTFYFERKD